MSADTDALRLATKTVLCDIAKHAGVLATGLQNVAPPQGSGASVLYLSEMTSHLTALSRRLDDEKLMLVDFVKEAVGQDDLLREKHHIGEKFRFIRDKLHALLAQLEKHATIALEEKKTVSDVAADERLVYVYLYNSQGMVLPTWLNMLTAKLFYEYSVNRPIYDDQAYVDLLLRSKPNKVQHAFLTVAVRQVDIVRGEEAPKDTLGHPVVRVKEGALRFERLIAFTHNGQDYVLSENRELIKKQ